MSVNSTPKLGITSDLRTKVIQKFTILHSKLQTNVTPEQLERSCYDKANNEQDAYLRLCNNLVANRTRQLEIKGNVVPNSQVRTVMNSNFRPNIVGQINNIEPDPINALTNLTVTAGQPNQITMQPGHQQINYRINTATQPGIMQLNSINPQMGHQRLMVSGNNIRQLDQFGMSQQQHQMSQSPNAQLMSNQMPNAQMQVHTIGQVNTGNVGNTIRIINKGSTIKQEQIISANQPMQTSPYQIDGNGGPIVNQHINQVMHGSVARSPGMRMVTNSPRMGSQHQSPQEHYPMSGPTVSASSTATSISTQPEEPQAPPQAPSNPGSQAAPSSSIKSPLSEQETAQVKDEMSKLSAKYYKSLSLAVENPMNTNVETLKVWSVLRDLLDTSKPCNKPISMKHVAKIKLYSEKAEEHVKLHQLDPAKTPRRAGGPTSSTSSSTTLGAAAMSGSSDLSGAGTGKGVGSCDSDLLGGQNQAQTLESAMDKVIHDINSQELRHKRKVRDSLINYIRTKCPQYMYMLPRHLPPTEPEGMDTSEPKLDEHEFDFIDHLPIDGVDEMPPVSHRAFDNDGLLRIDSGVVNCVSESADLAGELMLLSREFEIVSLERQAHGPGWTCTNTEADWDRNSLFYSVRIRPPLDMELPAEVPPVIVRIPEDYEHSLSVDWNINVPLYPGQSCSGTSNTEIFLLDVLVTLQEELSALALSPWNSVSLLYILSIYKRCIRVGYSNYNLRNQFS